MFDSSNAFRPKVTGIQTHQEESSLCTNNETIHVMECPALGSFSETSDDQIMSEILKEAAKTDKVNLFLVVFEVGQPLNKDFHNQLKAY
jgi:hypothetical protein